MIRNLKCILCDKSFHNLAILRQNTKECIIGQEFEFEDISTLVKQQKLKKNGDKEDVLKKNSNNSLEIKYNQIKGIAELDEDRKSLSILWENLLLLFIPNIPHRLQT